MHCLSATHAAEHMEATPTKRANAAFKKEAHAESFPRHPFC